MKKMNNFKRILIVEVNWLGDVLFSTVAIKAIKEKHPDCFLACMVVKRCAQVLENNPSVDEVIVFDEKSSHKSSFSKIKFMFSLRERKFDAVFLFHRSFTRALICYLAGIKRRIGYYRKKTAFLLTDKIEMPDNGLHRAEYYISLIDKVGIEAKDKNYEFFTTSQAEQEVVKLLAKDHITKEDNYIVINPGGNWDPKRWPAENYARLADKMMQELKYKIVISGAKKDIVLSQEISSEIKNEVVVLAGKTDLNELGALLKRASVVISADSGPMHLASALGTPVVAIFGPTSPQVTGPYNKKAQHIILRKDVGCLVPCYEVDCPDNKCMKAVTVDEVFNAVKKTLNYDKK